MTAGNGALDAYRLTPMQQGMLYHTVSAPGSDVYVQQLSCELSGPLDAETFAAAWSDIFARHGVLRTAFAWRDLPEPLQIVGPKVATPLEIQDWRGLPEAEQDAALERLRTSERQRAFDLQRAPLTRLKLAQTGDETHHLVWTWHHAILDAWSAPILVEEMFAAYAARLRGRTPALPATRPFRDFVAWRAGRDMDAAEEYWRDRLAELDEPTPLGVDRKAPRSGPDRDDSDYGLQFIDIPAEEMDRLREAAKRARLPLNSFVQGAWAILLGRYSGRDEVVFGAAVAGRPPELPGVETMVGLTINTVPVRVEVGGDQRLGDWLQAAQAAQDEARPHEHASLSDIQGWSGLPRQTPLFDSLFVFENFPLDMRRFEGGGLRVADYDFAERANFPLTVTMTIRERGRLGVGYDRDRFDDAAMARLLGHMRSLLAEMCGDPNRRLAQLNCVTEAERDRLLHDFAHGPRAGQVGADSERAVTRTFEDVARWNRDRTAAVFAGADGDETLTYAELNACANRFARRLQRLGTENGARVAICMDASLSRLAGILGVMKAGGVFVPLEASSPPALLRDLIQDCGATVVLTGPCLEAALKGAAPHTMALGDMPNWAADEDPADLKRAPEADDTAYLIYTSGSTGKPKGVIATHAGLQHLAAAQIHDFGISSDSRELQFASLSFDASVSEIFTALLAGAAIYMAPRDMLLPSHDMVRLLQRWRISVATIPPSVLARLPDADLPDLKTLVSAGEPCPAALVDRWAAGRRFLNAYGPTEITVCATIGEAAPGGGKPDIGWPMGDARIYILDGEGRPVPIGVAGHLHVGGPGVTLGYWNRPALTDAAFIADPYCDDPDAHLYRTGDRARFGEDGRVEFLGRIDDQVKLRGFRVEPGEIEAALRSAPGVRDAAVVVTDDEDGDRRLVAWVTPQDAERSAPEWWPSIAEFYVYDDLAYHAMTSDERRNDSYRAAIAETVKDRVVLEVGTGPEALLSRFCIEAGARKVYAVELLDETYRKACARVRELGLEDRIIVIHGDATQVELPEPAEVCVSEIVGALGGSEGAAKIINGVRRLLTPDTGMVPRRSVTMFAPVELPEALVNRMGFGPLPARYVARIFEDKGYPFDLRLCASGLDRSCLLADPQPFEDLDYERPCDPEFTRAAEFRISRPGAFSGFLAWLTLDCGAGPVLDILEHEHCWLPVFFPASHPGIAVAAGDAISATASARLCDNGLNPDYGVEGVLRRAGGGETPFRHLSRHDAPVFRDNPFHAAFFADAEVPTVDGADPAFDSDAALRFLRERLPKHMIPSRIASIDAMPLTAAGKIDRRALRARTAEAPATPGDEALTPPRNAQEAAIARIWADVLKLDQVGLQTNFFDQGGHSLLLLQVQDRLKAELGAEVVVTDLFKYPTVESLAARLALMEAGGAAQPAAPDAGRQRADARQAAMGRAAARRRASAAAEGDAP